MAGSDEERRRLEEIRRKAEEEEAQRIEEEVSRRTESFKKLKGKKKPPTDEEEHKRKEEDLTRREEEQRRREEELERRQQAADERMRAVDDETRRRDDETSKRRREDEEQRKREEAERRRVEEEERERRTEEERQRTKVLKRARELLAQKDFDRALAETANILAIDPMQPETLELEQRIRAAKAEFEANKPREAEQQPGTGRIGQSMPPPTAPTFPTYPPPPSTKPAEPKAPAEGRKAEERRERPPVVRPPRKPLPKGAIAGAAVAILVVVGGIILFQMSKKLFEGDRYIAVLPFVSQSGRDEERVLGPALAEEVATMLSHFPNTRIMGPSTALNLQRRFRDPRTKANQLRFPYAITGTISTEGSLALKLDIIDTLGNKMWSGRVERSRERVMDLPVELVRTLSDAFELTLPSEQRQVMTPATSSSGAYLAYLRGRYLLHRGTPSATNEALSLFLQAVSEDPGFAEAQAATGHAYFHLFEAGWTEDPATLTKAEEAARKALSIRAPFAEARTVLGGVFAIRTRYREALTELEQAVAGVPSNTEAERLLGIVHAIGGNERKALDHLNRAHELDPVNVSVLASSGLVYQRFGKPKEAMAYFDQALPFVGDTLNYLAETAGDVMMAAYQYDRAISLFERRVALEPRNFVNQYTLARAYQLAGREATVWSRAFEKTIAIIQQELQSHPQNALALAYLGLAYSRYGRFPEGEANAKKAAQIAPNDLMIRYKLADIYSIQKKKNEALSTLLQAIRTRYVLQEVVSLDLFNVSVEPEFAETISQSLE